MYEGGWDRDIKPVSAGEIVTASCPYASGAINGSNLITEVDATLCCRNGSRLFCGWLRHSLDDPGLFQCRVPRSNYPQKTTVTLPIAQFVAFAPQQMFLFAVKRSQAWASAMLTFFSQFGSGSAMPAEYIASDLRWGHTFRRLTDLATPNGVMSTFSGSRSEREPKFVQLAFEKEWRTVRRLEIGRRPAIGLRLVCKPHHAARRLELNSHYRTLEVSVRWRWIAAW